MNNISFSVNNGGSLNLYQDKKDGSVKVTRADFESGEIKRSEIPAGDMVMLLNYYHYIKDNNIQCDFINPYGTNK